MEGSGSTLIINTLRAINLDAFESGDTKSRFESVSESMKMFTYQYYRSAMLEYTTVASE